MNKALEELINYVKDSKEYKTCIDLKKKMSENEEITSLVEEVKLLQKKYIKSNYDENIKKELDLVNEKLDNIPIYVIYKQNLEVINQMIGTINDELNNYFERLFNNKI